MDGAQHLRKSSKSVRSVLLQATSGSAAIRHFVFNRRRHFFHWKQRILGRVSETTQPLGPTVFFNFEGFSSSFDLRAPSVDEILRQFSMVSCRTILLITLVPCSQELELLIVGVVVKNTVVPQIGSVKSGQLPSSTKTATPNLRYHSAFFEIVQVCGLVKRST